MTATAKKTAAYEITENLKFDVITEGIRRGTQSIIYESILKVTHFTPPQDMVKKVKIWIKRDSYDFQSSGSISVWSVATESWNEIARVACTKGSLFHEISVYQDDTDLVVAKRRMKIIAGNLINTAAEVIF